MQSFETPITAPTAAPGRRGYERAGRTPPPPPTEPGRGVDPRARPAPRRRGVRLITAFGLAAGWAGLLLLLAIAALGAPSSYLLGMLVGRLILPVVVSTVGTWVAARNATWRTGSLVALSGGVFAVSVFLFVIVPVAAP